MKKIIFRQLLLISIALIISSEFTASAQSLSQSNDPLYPIFEKGYWGLINSSGKVILPPRFDKISRYPEDWNPGKFDTEVLAYMAITASRDPITDTVIPVILNGKTGFATREGKILSLGLYDKIYWYFSEGLYRVFLDGQYGFADELGKLVIPTRFALAETFYSGYAFVKIDGQWGVIDSKGALISPPIWDEIRDKIPGKAEVTIRKGTHWGVINRSGKIIIPPRYEKILNPSTPLVTAVDSGQYVYLRPGGEVAFEFKCAKRFLGTPKTRCLPLFSISAFVKCGDLYGLIDMQGDFLVQPTWDDIRPFYEGRAIVKVGEKSGIIDDLGNYILKPNEEIDIANYNEGLASFNRKRSLIGYFDLDGNIVIPPSFERTLGFSGGLAAVSIDGKFGYVDHTGSWVIQPIYWKAKPFRGPLAVVESKEKNGKHEVSYIDRAGNVVYKITFHF